MSQVARANSRGIPSASVWRTASTHDTIKTTASLLSATKPPFHQGPSVAKSHLFLNLNCTLCSLDLGVKWLLLFPAVCQEKPVWRDPKQKVRLNWGCVRNVVGKAAGWPRLPVHCFHSTSSLFHSVTGRRRLATIKSVEPRSVFLPVSMAKATHLSVMS